METSLPVIKRHPVLAYYVLAFVISWGGVLILGAPYGMPTSNVQFQKVWPIVFIPYFLGPSLASLLLTGIIDGRVGFRALWFRLLRWRVGVRWYAVALLTAPLLVTLILFLLSLASSEYLPAIVTANDKISVLLMGTMVGLIEGGLLEELGWTGFAVPRLRLQYSVFATGLIVGALHAVWHFLPTFWASGDPLGTFSLLLFLPPCVFYAGVLPAFRILMVWVYDHTQSLLVSLLMHASLTASTLFILSPAATGVPLIIYYLILTVVMWAVVAALASRRQLAEGTETRNRPS
jgi:membrane protease YdiL (CAAX protease family)